MLAHGDKVRDYEIIAPIRSGGMAMLYLARRRGVGGFSRLVALKLVHAHLTDDPNINRLFLQEARIAASVAHPNVVHVEEVGVVDGKYFIAMEYVHGVSLAQFLTSLQKQHRRMSPKLCVWIAAQISEALHAVHEATLENGVPLNIVHRDVSPQNVLIGHTGHIKLIDFGIAKSQLMSYQASRGGSVLGKLRYMAPEQLQLRPVSRRTDVYALGVMLWEMLASRNLLRCFRIDDERDWATREAPPPPSKHAPSLPKAIDQAVLKAIACAPDARYENALSFRRAVLRAEPSASQVDPPAFAALIHHLLGEELERSRAAFPNEVNVQLDSDVVSDTGPALNLEELTARLRASEVSDPICDEEPDEPTHQASSSSVGADFTDDETVVRQPTRANSQRRPEERPAPQAHIVTVPARASLAQPTPARRQAPARRFARLSRALKKFARRKGAFDTAALALFVALAAYAAASVPRVSLHLIGGKAAAGYVNRGSSVPTAATHAAAPVKAEIDAQPPLKLHETQIVSAVRPAAPKPITGRANAFSGPNRKRTSLPRNRALSAKSKVVVSQRSPKLARP